MRVRFDIQGFDTLRRRFEALRTRVQGQVLIKAARAGAKPILERARELAPQRTGALARRGIVARDTTRKATYAERRIGYTDAEFYGKFQELGVAPHRQGKGTHPGHVAKPHLRPAFDEMKKTAIGDAQLVLETEILKAASS